MAIAILLALTSAAPLAAQDVRSIGTRTRTPSAVPASTESITLDGAVTEALWSQALRLPLRYEVRPGENIEPPVATDMLLVHDTRNLYVAFRSYDNDPSAIRARFSDRDAIWDDDFVGVVLDTFNDERRAYEFFANPLGIQGDALQDDVAGREDNSWNAIWDSAGRVTADGYEVEMVIPFSQLRFRASDGPQIWGIDGVRSYPRRDRALFGLFPRIRGENSYLAQEDKISGFAGVRPGQNLEIVPTLTTVRSDARTAFPDGPLANVRTDADLGLTTQWGVTPNVTLSGTINPDFSQVEADALQLDVNNQFALFFNETRPFFLEGADFFETAGRLNLLHTRQVAQPKGAVKVSGKTGRHAFGFFSAEDSETTVILPGSEGSQTRRLDADNLASVGRYRFDLGENSTIGAMVTDRRGGGYANTVVAIDTRHRFSAADSVSGTIAYSSTDDAPTIAPMTSMNRRGDMAVDVSYNHSVRTWEASGRYVSLGDAFRADLGFITQVNTRRWEAGGSRTWHGDATRFYNRIQFRGDFDQTNEDTSGALIEREWEGYLSMDGPRESSLEWGGGFRTRVFNRVSFDQRFQSARAEVRPSRDLQFGVRLNWGDWIDFANTRPADQRTIRPFINLNVGRHVEVRFSHIYDTLAVQGGTLFSAQAPELRLVYQRDARTLFRAIVQYTNLTRDPALYPAPIDRQARDLFAQLLFSYKVNAQTALYLGYAHGAEATDRYDLTSASRTFFAKLSYAWLM